MVGPVKIDYSQYYVNSTSNASTIVKAAVNAADSLVNYADYDRDGDGAVDMVYFIFAGAGSNFSGNDSRLIWPHASTMSVRLDGVNLGRYACSTELYGKEASQIIDGIGTVCHEFSHVLGLPDEYDTDYASSGGQSIHPAKWSVMASGSYLNQSRTPVGYSLYERYSLLFATPEVIEGDGSYTLNALNTSNSGYRINSAIDDEFFIIENRQQTRWDEYLPGHGMLIFRVDSTDVDIWEENDINVNPSHNYYELLRATPQTSSSGTVTDSEGDPFPGSGNVTAINNSTTPSISSWTGLATSTIISNITESSDGVITFKTSLFESDIDVEGFETMPVTSRDTTAMEGLFCNWTFIDAIIDAPDTAYCNGAHAVGLLRKGEIITSVISKEVETLSFNVCNPTSSSSIFRSYYSLNGGTSWVSMKTLDGVSNISVSAGSTVNLVFNPAVENACYRIVEYTGSSSQRCYVDDVTFSYKVEESGVENLISDKIDDNGLTVSRQGSELVISGCNEDYVYVYGAGGVLVVKVSPVEGTATATLPGRGFYVVSLQGHAMKVIY